MTTLWYQVVKALNLSCSGLATVWVQTPLGAAPFKGDIRGDGLVAGPLDMCCSGQMWIQRRTDGLGFKRQPRTVQEQDEWRRL
ncbi:unnamed protein product [Enterobius vermicularis]|uniref:Secreted protein n=1 Tax=Enterobius vermicularis TaxID=51028 RepID=A0A0N4UTI1_ENTVE|nr:unnamed protein product [Enterobius vermicularis]